MSNPDLENDAPKPVEGADVTRRVDEIELRDFDRIRERTPFQLQPVHIRVAVAAVVAAVALALAVGWLLGRNTDNARPAIPEIRQTNNLTDVEMAAVADNNQQNTIVQADSTARKRRTVQGSVLPLPGTESRPHEASETIRRGIDEVRQDDFNGTSVDWWERFVASECAYTCIEPYCACSSDIAGTCPEPTAAPQPDAAAAPEPDAVAAPQPDAAAAPGPDAVAAPQPDAVAAPQPDVVAAPQPDAVAAPQPDAVAEAELQPEKIPGPAAALDTRTETQPESPETVAAKDLATSKVPERQKATERKLPADKARNQTRENHPVPPMKYSVQIRSFKEESIARDFAREFAAKGYDTFVVSYVDPVGTTWFRVRTGHFATAAEATAFAAGVNSKEAEQAIPVEAK